MARVVVVGGGLAGCASAARLAKLGHEVTVVERLPRLGGAVGTLEQDGYAWDTGPAVTALPAVLRDLFRKSGRPLERELSLEPVVPLRQHRFADGTVLTLPSGSRGAQLAAVDEALGAPRRGGPGYGQQWADYVHQQGQAWDALRRDFLEHPYDPGRAGPATLARLSARRTLHREVARRFTDDRLRTLARHHAVQAGHDPRNVPAWWGMLDYLEQNFGTWTTPGGLGRLAPLLAKRLGERGVSVLTDTTATDLVLTGGRPSAVRTDRGEVDAERVVVAVDPRLLPALARFVERTMPTVPPTVTHLGLVGEVPRLPGEVVLHHDYVLTVRTGGQAPDGRTAWTLLGRGRLAEDMVVALARHDLDVRHAVEVRVDRTPRQQVEQWGGSPYGVLWQGRATVRRRLGTTTPLPHVYAAGAHTGGGGWLPFVGLSAAQVAEAIGPA